MTLKQKAIELMTERGMFLRQAEEVFEAVKDDPTNAIMADRWNDDVEGYQPEILSALWLSVRRCAIEWIDAKLPRAWFRPMFTSDPDAEIERLTAQDEVKS